MPITCRNCSQVFSSRSGFAWHALKRHFGLGKADGTVDPLIRDELQRRVGILTVCDRHRGISRLPPKVDLPLVEIAGGDSSLMDALPNVTSSNIDELYNTYVALSLIQSEHAPSCNVIPTVEFRFIYVTVLLLCQVVQ